MMHVASVLRAARQRGPFTQVLCCRTLSFFLTGGWLTALFALSFGSGLVI